MAIKRWALVASMLVLVAAAVFLTGRGALGPATEAQSTAFHGTLVEPLRPAPDFVLLDHNGNSFRLSEQLGRIAVLFFGYASCPDVCPATLVDFMRTKAELSSAEDQVQFIFITVDPERDTPDKLGKYVGMFDSAFVGLSGDPVTLQAVWDDYGVLANKLEPVGDDSHYWMLHSSYTYVIDRKGQLRLIYPPFEVTPAQVAADLKRLLG